jgi:cyclic pyranopterin phosphate synthase
VTPQLRDSHGRVLKDLRISITDRCNFRCLYCLPETEEAANFYRTRFDALRNPNPSHGLPIHHEWKPKNQILRFEEITRLARIGASLGITKLRLTGGEPLLRQGIEELVESLSAIPGIEDIAITTNGFLFARKAEALRKAGLMRVSFSMDSLDPVNFKRMTGREGQASVLEGIRIARELGFQPIKVNAVVIRGLNDHEIEDLAEFARREDLQFRFIEFMPLDSSRAWQLDHVVRGSEILERLLQRFAMVPVDQSANPSETARRWRFPDGRGEIGIIAPVSQPFCGHCNRIRLTADGKVRTCLFSIHEHDLKPMLRGSASDSDIASALQQIVLGKEAGHRIGQKDFVQPARTMSCIGG